MEKGRTLAPQTKHPYYHTEKYIMNMQLEQIVRDV